MATYEEAKSYCEQMNLRNDEFVYYWIAGRDGFDVWRADRKVVEAYEEDCRLYRKELEAAAEKAGKPQKFLWAARYVAPTLAVVADWNVPSS